MKETSCTPATVLIPLALLIAILGPQAKAQFDEPDPAEVAAAIADYHEGLRNARNALVYEGDFEAALSPAQIIVSELEASDEDVWSDRIMLAVILAELESFDEAEIQLLSVVETLSDDAGLYAESLIPPLRLLGRTYMQANRFPEAVTALTQAREVSRRSAGLFNVEHQIGVIDDLTSAQLGLRDTRAAHDLQLDRLATAQRQFGAGDPQLIPYHNHLASYLERSRLRKSAREQYHHVLEIAEANNDTAAILTALSNITRQDLQTGTLLTALERLDELVRTPAAEPHTYELGIAHTVLGDAALVDEEESLADEHYARAWELLAESGAADPAEYFKDPTAIRLIPPLTAVDIATRPRPYEYGTIEVVFDVGEDGRVIEVTAIGARPQQMMEGAYVERIESAWFRPALVDGERIAASDVLFTHIFRYFPETDD